MPFFEGSYARRALCAHLSGTFPAPAQYRKRFLCGSDLLLELSARLFERGDFSLPRGDIRFLLRPLNCQPLQLRLRHAHALGYARHFGIELTQHVAGGHRLMLGFTFFAFKTIEQGGELLNFPPQR